MVIRMNRRFCLLPLAVILLAAWASPVLCEQKEGEAASGAAALPPLPHAVISFGSEVLDGYVYVYGGHAGETHKWSVETTLDSFLRLELEGGTRWEELPGASRSQGNRLVAYDGRIYRIGGMQPRPKPEGEGVALFSLTDFQAYDPAKQKWIDLEPLPAPRSSHEAVVVGSRLYVGGGWNLSGGRGGDWYGELWWIDLENKGAGWQSSAQPFKRRAISSEASEGKIWFMGGIDQEGDTSRKVDIYDTATGEWKEGPRLPSGPMQGFGSAACQVGGRLVVSTYSMKIFTPAGEEWEQLGSLAERRYFHRIVPVSEDRIMAISGTARQTGKNASVEIVALP